MNDFKVIEWMARSLYPDRCNADVFYEFVKVTELLSFSNYKIEIIVFT